MNREALAITGIGCRFPSADGPDGYWQLLADGRSAIRPLPLERWRLTAEQWSGLGGKVLSAGLIDGIDQFDWRAFRISPREAKLMDPQHRLLLHVAWEALEDAGIPFRRAAGRRIGVFIGAMWHDYLMLQVSEPARLESYSATGHSSFAANRISFFFDFRGPSLAFDGGCSSSLLALYYACQHLWRHDIEVALVGGVNILASPVSTLMLDKAEVLSPNGMCRTFDAAANGFVVGEGAGIVVLKPLARALSDGDRVYAVIRGGAVNSVGHSDWIMAPTVDSQVDLLRSAYDDAAVSPATVDYVELHGTGTGKGDPIEAEALGKVLGQAPGRKSACRVGSVKTNVGHLESAAGVASLIKVALALHHRRIPSSLNFSTVNPAIALDRDRLKVQTSIESWPRDVGHPRRAGVTSLSLGGVNAHFVVEEAPESEPAKRAVTRWKANGYPSLVPLSARTTTSLQRYAKALRGELGKSDAPSVEEVAYQAALRREHHPCRAALVAADPAELRAQLDALAAGQPAPGLFGGQIVEKAGPPIFVYSGQGSAWQGMAGEALEIPGFRDAIEACDAEVSKQCSWSLMERLLNATQGTSEDDVEIAQPILFAMQVAISAVLKAWGIEPSLVLGHSLGEIAAAHAAGFLSLADATRIACSRGRALKRISGRGKMATIELSSTDAAHFLRQNPDYRVSIASYNAPTTTVVSGEATAIRSIVDKLSAREVFAKMIRVDFASHCEQVEEIREEFLRSIAGIESRVPQLRMVSSVDPHQELKLADASYWWRNLRQPVRFAEAVETAVREGARNFVEVSPHPILSASIQQTISRTSASAKVVPTMRRDTAPAQSLLGAVGALYCGGTTPRWESLVATQPLCRLPRYQWDSEPLWYDDHRPPAPAGTVPPREFNHPVLCRHVKVADPVQHLFDGNIEIDRAPFHRDHCLFGDPVLTGAAYIELALAAAGQLGLAPTIENLCFRRALELKGRHAIQVVVGGTGERRKVGVYSASDGAEWGLHAEGELLLHAPTADASHSRLDFEAIRSRLNRANATERYDRLEKLGNRYGPAFRNISDLSADPKEGLGAVHLSARLAADPYVIHPALLDASAHLLAMVNLDAGGGAFMPVSIRRVRLLGKCSGTLWSYAQIRSDESTGKSTVKGDVTIANERGQIVMQLDGLEIQYLEGVSARWSNWLYGVRWIDDSTPRKPLNRGLKGSSWLVFAEDSGSLRGILPVMQEQGDRAVLVSPRDRSEDTFERLDLNHYRLRRGSIEQVAALFGALGEKNWPTDIVFCWAVRPPTDAKIDERVANDCATVAAIVQQMSRQKLALPRVWIVTRGAQPAADGEQLHSPWGAAMWGFGRTIALEHPALWGGLIDLDPEDRGNAAIALKEALLSSPEDQILLRGGKRRVPRLCHERARRNTTRTFGSEGTYLITGGLGGIGRQTARWLAERGARNIVLVGRRALPPRKDWTVEAASSAWGRQIRAVLEMEQIGANVRACAADVADEASLGRVFSELRADGWPEVRGIIHSAGVGHLAPLTELNADQVDAVLRAKVAGAWVLHQKTERLALDFFVLFSSGASIISSPRLAAYAAGNAFLDALAYYRRSRGLPGLSINWGLWEEEGMAEIFGKGQQWLKAMGSFTTREGLEALSSLLDHPKPQVALLPVDWKGFKQLYAGAARSPFLSDVLPSDGEERSSAEVRVVTRELLLQMGPQERRSTLEKELSKKAAKILRIPVEDMATDRSLVQLGFDSLMALELKNELENSLKVMISLIKLLRKTTIKVIADEIANNLEQG